LNESEADVPAEHHTTPLSSGSPQGDEAGGGWHSDGDAGSAAPAGRGDLLAAVALLWGQRPAPKRGPKPTLSLEAIARTGIEIADADGLAAVTMQSVAAALGFTKMALYRYVPGKVELVALMTDIGMGAPPPLGGEESGWRARLDQWARRLFELFLQHPWALETTVGARAVGPNELSWLEQAVTALGGTGLRGHEVLDAAVTLTGHARAIAQQETATGGEASTEHSLNAFMAAVMPTHGHRFPALGAVLAEIAELGGQGQAFDFGLARILDGIELLITARASGSGSETDTATGTTAGTEIDTATDTTTGAETGPDQA
jgi:AcrR family transcriptional regulator